MEPLPQELKEKGKKKKEKGTSHVVDFAFLLFPFSLCLIGCTSMGRSTAKDDKLPTGPACQAVAAWSHQVMVTPDPVHGGAPTPGIAGRVYLFGTEGGVPLVGDGTITVDLYDDSPKAAGNAPVLLEEWRIDKDTLKRLLKQDAVGWGYTLFLPWGTYRPDIKHIHLALRYEPAKGTPLYAPAADITLHHGACTTAVATKLASPRAVAERPGPIIPASAREADATSGAASARR